MTWPAWYPSECPPESATESSGEFYRLVENNPVEESDFETALEEFNNGARPRTWNDDTRAAAVSVFSDQADIEKIRGAAGGIRAVAMIARGNITGSGKMATKTSRVHKSHVSWWRPVEDSNWSTFQVMT